MKIEVHTLAHQEAKLVPYVMRHYKDWADVYVYTGYSSDGTEKMLEDLGAKIIFLDTKNEANDAIFRDMKNNCWKGSKADWVIITDFDEIVHHRTMLVPEALKDKTCTLIKPFAYNIFSETFPVIDSQIYDEVKMGTVAPAKFNLFRPSEIKEMNFGVGCHNANPEGNIIIEDSDGTDMVMLHCRNLGTEYVLGRNKYTAKRLSQVNIKHQWGLACTLPDDIIIKYLEEQKRVSFRIL
jgi:hypothetical protein